MSSPLRLEGSFEPGAHESWTTPRRSPRRRREASTHRVRDGSRHSLSLGSSSPPPVPGIAIAAPRGKLVHGIVRLPLLGATTHFCPRAREIHTDPRRACKRPRPLRHILRPTSPLVPARPPFPSLDHGSGPQRQPTTYAITQDRAGVARARRGLRPTPNRPTLRRASEGAGPRRVKAAPGRARSCAACRLESVIAHGGRRDGPAAGRTDRSRWIRADGEQRKLTRRAQCRNVRQRRGPSATLRPPHAYPPGLSCAT